MTATYTDITPERRAAVALDSITLQRRKWERENRRPPALSAREALAALVFEAHVVLVCAVDTAARRELSDEDLARMLLAVRRIITIADEATQ